MSDHNNTKETTDWGRASLEFGISGPYGMSFGINISTNSGLTFVGGTGTQYGGVNSTVGDRQLNPDVSFTTPTAIYAGWDSSRGALLGGRNAIGYVDLGFASRGGVHTTRTFDDGVYSYSHTPTPNGWTVEFTDKNTGISTRSQQNMDPTGSARLLQGIVPAHRSISKQCFPCDVRITSSKLNDVLICDIGIGDAVLSFSMGLDCKSNSRERALFPARVTRLFRNVTDEWVVVRPAEGFEAVAMANGFDELTATPGHETLSPDGRFRPLLEILMRGDGLVLADGSVCPVTYERIRYSAETAHLYEEAEIAVPRFGYGGVALEPEIRRGWATYNFEVEHFHTYIANGVRVHNDSELYTELEPFVDDPVIGNLVFQTIIDNYSLSYGLEFGVAMAVAAAWGFSPEDAKAMALDGLTPAEIDNVAIGSLTEQGIDLQGDLDGTVTGQDGFSDDGSDENGGVDLGGGDLGRAAEILAERNSGKRMTINNRRLQYRLQVA